MSVVGQSVAGRWCSHSSKCLLVILILVFIGDLTYTAVTVFGAIFFLSGRSVAWLGLGGGGEEEPPASICDREDLPLVWLSGVTSWWEKYLRLEVESGEIQRDHN
jgi:hypothetical protein